MTKPPWLRAHGRPWARGAARVVYDNPWIRVTEYAATAPTGHPATYGLVSYKNLAIAILPLFDDGATVLVGQNRFPLMEYSWEIPEGGGPMADDPLESARRELAEETGLEAAEWREILRAQLSNSVSDERAVAGRHHVLKPHPATPSHADRPLPLECRPREWRQQRDTPWRSCESSRRYRPIRCSLS